MRTSFFVACLALSVLLPSTPAAAQSAQDKAIAQEIGGQLKSSGQLHDYRIGVKYKDGVAALSGTVADKQQLLTAVRLTQRMGNVSQVVNNLTIAGEGQPAQPTQQPASPEAFAATGTQSPRAVRTSYEPSGPQFQGPQFQGRPNQGPPNQGQFGQQANQYQNQMAQRQSMAPRQSIGPQRPMATNRMQAPRRNNTPMPMGGRPPIQLASAQRPMQPPMRQPMGPMQAGCNCGPGGPGGYDGGGYDGGYGGGGMMGGPPAAMGYVPGGQSGAVNYDNAQMPGYAWPSYASYPNYAALSYPQQYSPSAWPYIGPFYPYPQVPLGWRKVCLEWDDGWWFLDFSDCGSNH
jgi:BON domain